MIKNNHKNLNKLAYSAFLVSAMSFSFKLIAFLKQTTIAYIFGLNVELDSYFMALSFVIGGADIIVQALYVSLVTSYTALLIKSGKNKADYLINSILEFFFPLFLIFIILFMIFSTIIAKFLVPDKCNFKLQYLVSKFIFLLSPTILFSLIELVFGAVIDSHKKYVIPRLKSLIYSIIIIFVSIFLSKYIGVYSLVVGEFLTGIVFSFILFITVQKYCKLKLVRLKMTLEIKQCIKTSIPLFIGNGALQINAIIDNSLASTVGAGCVSALAYCHIITDIINQIVIVNIGNIIFTHFAEYIAKEKIDLVKDSIQKFVNIFIVILLFITIIFSIYSEDIVKILFGRGEFSVESIKLTASALVGYSFSFIIVGIKILFLKANYSFSDTIYPMIASICSIILNIVLSIILVKYFGLLGIALGSSFSYILELIINYKAFTKKVKDFSLKYNAITFIKMIPAAILLAVVSVFVKNIININSFFKIMISSLSGIIIFIISSILTNVKEVKNIFYGILPK